METMTPFDTAARPDPDALLAQLEDAVVVLDDAGRISYASPPAGRFLGAPSEALVGVRAFEYVDPRDRAAVLDAFEELVTDPATSSRRTEFRLLGEGTSVWLEAVTVDATASDVGGYVATLRDVTEHRVRERDLERLHDSTNHLYAAESVEESYRIAIDAAVSILGFDWCTLATPADDGETFEIAAISEHAPLEVGDRPFGLDEGVAGHVYQTGTASVVDDARGSSRGKPVDPAIRSALTVPVGDWGVFQAVTTTRSAFDDRDRNRAQLLVTAMVTAIDRIERRRDLERQNERLDQFVRYVSHDLRTPLTTAAGYLELMVDDIDGSPAEIAHVRDAHEQMEAMIDQLSTWARGDDLARDRTAISVASVAGHTWSSVAPESASLSIEMTRLLEADRTCFRQLVENLLRNAVTHVGDDVSVRVEELERGFAIEDDGPGIPPDARDDVFEPGHTCSEAGTGLGLAIVAEIVSAHGWEIAVTEGSAGGARFEITGVDFAD
ncbi:hypothetical protein AArcMg_0504 [Natrarchaeobaculum sulfurireducens]|uniref:histidine kinase n=2 Tax=Natrarchaeobaculum sulfurireducens TaxID=2044521 RepID=A0A346PLY2_9EURY|nr:hypothetical protein AArcMg_0504 [Natrarchaeobaculum sulfurireducens]